MQRKFEMLQKCVAKHKRADRGGIMNDCAITQEFINYLTYEKHFSSHTAKCYSADLLQFGVFLSDHTEDNSDNGSSYDSRSAQGSVAVAVQTQTQLDIGQLLLAATVDTFRNYLAHLNGKGYSKSTIARKLATLRSFYKFLVKRNHLSSNPVTAVRTPKQEKKLPKFLEYEQVQKLLNTPGTGSWLATRDRAILETLYSTGMRVSEIVSLNMDDIDFLGEVVHVRGKGKKERLTPIGSSALQAIQQYIECRSKRSRRQWKFRCKGIIRQ